ncbi:MAG: DUF4238 domain-containing protein [Pseudomonadota bacterium]
MNTAVAHHYVPKWYQKRFLDSANGATTFLYLDMRPDRIPLPGGAFKFKKSIYIQGPKPCFEQPHLYTLFFGADASDAIESQFFGKIDQHGEAAVLFFENYTYQDGTHEKFRFMRQYLGAQLFRTPKGLRLLQALAGTRSHQDTLRALVQYWELYATIWSEGVWEIVNCKSSPTKFLISDNPVTTYNKQIFPASEEMRQLGIARFERLGTHTVFPLGPEYCLCITNLQYVRNPKSNPLKIRENPRYYGQGLFNLRNIQRGREIPESEVLAINHVLKSNAVRYIAAQKEEWLYPEKYLPDTNWQKLGGKYFLHPDPRKVSFTTGIFTGGGRGPSLGTNEYGHYDLDNAKAKSLREVEWRTFQSAQTAWDERDRRAGKAPQPLDPDYF